MRYCDKIDRHKCTQLFLGVVGINVTFVICGVLFEWMTKLPYNNVETGKQQLFRSAVGLICIERGIVWLLAEIYNRITISKLNAVKMPSKSLAICGFIIFFSSITNTQAIFMVSFPLTIMVKSCNIMSVILVGVLCSRVKDKKLKLGSKKIIVAIVVTVGIIMFRWFDPELDLSSDDGKKTQLFGFILLLASLLSDGFLPDFQAEVKEKYKPSPTQMMLQVNKWSFIFCLVYSIIVGQFWYTLQYCWAHPLFTTHLISMSSLTMVGQIFVYRMIKEFKQHIVPFVVTTRKIITVGFSLLYFHHKSSFGQVFGIILVFLVTAYEFLSQMLKEKKQEMSSVDIQQKNMQNLDQNDRLTQQNIQLSDEQRKK